MDNSQGNKLNGDQTSVKENILDAIKVNLLSKLV
jgi:hypothetical protein